MAIEITIPSLLGTERGIGCGRFIQFSPKRRGFIKIDSFLGDGVKERPDFKRVDKTELKVYLSHPLMPGDSLRLTSSSLS
jgi:hypothetical protein